MISSWLTVNVSSKSIQSYIIASSGMCISDPGDEVNNYDGGARSDNIDHV